MVERSTGGRTGRTGDDMDIRTADAWRRALVIALATCACLVAIAGSAPADAHARGGSDDAQRVGFVDDSPRGMVRGWTSLRLQTDCVANRCFARHYTAWSWSGTAWHRSSIHAGSAVYAWPYTGGWTWVWTHHTGWLAIESSKLAR